MPIRGVPIAILDAKYVPYTGATANVDLGLFDITATDCTLTGDLTLPYFTFSGATMSTPGSSMGITSNEGITLSAGANSDIILNPGGTGRVKIYDGAGSNYAQLDVEALTTNRPFYFPDTTAGILVTHQGANSDIDIGEYDFAGVDGHFSGIIYADGGEVQYDANRYLKWIDTAFYLKGGTINFQSADRTPMAVLYGAINVNHGLALRFTRAGPKWVGFKAPATVTTSVEWALPKLDSAGYFKSDGSANMSIANPLYSEVKRTSVVTYRNVLATATDNVFALDTWEDETTITFVNQPVWVRSIDVTVFPSPLQTITGTVTINGIDSDGAVVQEVFTFNTNVPETQTGDIQFAELTSIVTDATGAGTGLYSVGIGAKIGFPNYPLNATTDVIKVVKNDAHYRSANYTIDITNGTMLDIGVSPASADHYSIFYRPYK